MGGDVDAEAVDAVDRAHEHAVLEVAANVCVDIFKEDQVVLRVVALQGGPGAESHDALVLVWLI